ncbi:MAG: hypothetical protein GC189_02345 [Alphaproteobacteria bacterium]|nr:hypothetical protein [Alphaproteobacteria bacterium]
MKRSSVLWCAALALAACAPEERSPPLAHTAQVAAVLERTPGAAAFSDASTREAARLRHDQSGLVCALPSTGAFHVEPFPPSARNPGAACSIVIGDVATMLVAVRYGADAPLDQMMREAVGSVIGQASYEPWPGEPAD